MCAAADLEQMSDKLPLTKLGIAAVYSCSKLALLDNSDRSTHVHDTILPAGMNSATCIKPTCKDALNVTTLLSASSRH